ncbi:MAG TPA: hypothetical protein VGK73_07940 [Polyangiaceae bacterium]
MPLCSTMRIRTSLTRSLISLAVAAAPMTLSCGDLPDTTRPLPKSRGGDSGSGGSAPNAGSTAKGGTSSGGTSAGGKSGSSSDGGSATSGAGSGTGGNAGSGGGSGGSGAEGGEIEPGSGGAPDGGTNNGGTAGNAQGGSGGNLGGAGSGGTGGKAGSSSGGAGSGGSPTGEFFGDSRCSSDFLLCEDFEAASLDDIWTVQISGDDEPAPDDTRAARGDRSLHVHTVDNGLAFIKTDAPFPVADNKYYARIFVYFDALPTEPEWAHWTVSAGSENGEINEFEARTGGQWDGTSNRFGVGSDHGDTGDWTTLTEDDPMAVPEREWVCLEWMNDGGADEVRVWVNDEEHPSLHTTATDHGGSSTEDYILPDFGWVWFGWWHYQADTNPPEFDVWIDEIVVDDERIGCVD